MSMNESPKTKRDVVGVGCDDLLAQKRLQLKAARRESKKAAMRGRHNWGDFNRNQHIKELEREIQILRANNILIKNHYLKDSGFFYCEA